MTRLCACGCGEEVLVGGFRKGHLRKYVESHLGRLCKCGCGKLVFPTEQSPFKEYVHGHWSRGIPRHDYSSKMRAKVGFALRKYWATHTHTSVGLEKIRQARLGKKRPDEVKKKIAVKMCGNLNPAKRPEVREKIRVAIIEWWSLHKTRVPREGCFSFRSGFREDLGFAVRSSWEANFARLLKFLGREYVYEHRKFVLHNENGDIIGSYIPDFYVEDHFVEIWGYPGDVEIKRRKITHFQSEYFEFPLVIIDKWQYQQLEVKFSKYIPEWEF